MILAKTHKTNFGFGTRGTQSVLASHNCNRPLETPCYFQTFLLLSPNQQPDPPLDEQRNSILEKLVVVPKLWIGVVAVAV